MTQLKLKNQVQIDLENIQHSFAELREVKDLFARRNWFPATSGNLSVRVEVPDGEPPLIAVTASGKDKSVHTAEDFLLVDLEGKPVLPTRQKPSAETLVHTTIYQKIKQCQAIFHIHTVFNNLISELYGAQQEVTFTNQEIIKAFNIWDEGAAVELPIVENYAHIPTLAKEVGQVLDPRIPGVLIRNHGIYVWGDSVFAAKRHLEAFEFLFEYQVNLFLLKK
ncbi:methylthioribulose 1-phosphate dehydratase [Paenactinomyces guangxiensis]|uniref:Methylthioribulose-1-phosphate dehydratase n=1 Tax=Paenactinomyces guangxiensis TaxID=1490290 RepID=A0A7W2A8M7_9BACL|nr:methylthioribulose 1-phosphate dehydratase [Paenactinomyces guangxiensis]MBA4494359.1 methylthioribulose 1-phosphate dehydratase [Paenactinomyces guangxiensis]MBH8591586.1 methylthioribulose 1-phosphate dehydratase [Paenactinomyces guangxiensis]